MQLSDNPTNLTGIGASVLRIEDRRLLQGQGKYTGDIFLNSLCYGVVIRSPHAHANIRSIDSNLAKNSPGVLAIFTGADLIKDGIRSIPHNAEWSGSPDAEIRLPPNFQIFLPEHPAMPHDCVRYLGEPVVLIVAESEAIAIEAAEQVDIDFQPLPSVVKAVDALLPSASPVWPERANNISLECEVGDEPSTDAAFARAAHVVELDSWVQRVTGSPMEPRAVVGDYNSVTGEYSLYTASGRGVVQTRERLAYMLGVPLAKCRVISGDMGGNFGTRNAFFSEAFLMPWASRFVGRPIKWTATRSECFLSDYQGRDLAVEAELALDATGKFLGLRGINISNVGAYVAYFWPLRKGLSLMQSVYKIPAVYFKGYAVLSNTVPTAVYRSAGRPEAIYAIERLIDIAADKIGMDRLEIRNQNMIPSEVMPFTTAVGVTYDNGDYAATMRQAIEMADWKGFEGRKMASQERGLCRGIAIANYIEVTSGIPRERAELRVCEDDKIELVVGTMSSGQGHETSFAQLVSDWLDISIEQIRFISNDTNRVSVGGGSHSGRSMRLISIAIEEAIKDLLAKGRAISAQILSGPLEGITYKSGVFHQVDGKSVSLYEAAKAVITHNSFQEDVSGFLEGVGEITNRAGGYPYGSHVCEVEVDPETGEVFIQAWTAVDDVGRAINPLILHGQTHGAIFQGAGQALTEYIQHDPDSGQLLSGSFMDYAMPRANLMSLMKTILTETPASSHPHGIRPGGEGGTTPALAVIINAIIHALSEFGIDHIEMPATAARVWEAIQAARGNVKIQE